MSKKKTSATEKAKKDKKIKDDKNCQVDGQEESIYCICRRGEEGFMIQCSDCNEWFPRGGGGYLGQFLLGMCRWPLRTPTPL